MKSLTIHAYKAYISPIFEIKSYKNREKLARTLENY